MDGKTEITQQQIKDLIKIWEQFEKMQELGKQATPFKLNSDKETVNRLAKEVLSNEKNHGLKYCPSRMTTGDKKENIKLVCPCNFQIQQAWKESGECHSNLFHQIK